MKGYKSMGKGAVKYVGAFPSGSTPCGPQGRGASNSCKTMVRSHSRKRNFATGGSVGSSAVRRENPVTEADAEHGGKGPLLPGYAKGGPAAPRKPPVPPGRAKRMAGMAARLMKQGFSKQAAEAKCGGSASSSCRQFSRGGMTCGAKKKKCP